MGAEDGGQAVFVKAACGDRLGAINGWFVFLINLADASIYPQYSAAYLAAAFPHDSWAYLLAPTIVIVITFTHLWGVDVLTSVSSVLGVLALFPCLVFILLGLPHLSLHRLNEVEQGRAPDLNWALMISWVIWIYSGWSSFGSIAGEVVSLAVSCAE